MPTMHHITTAQQLLEAGDLGPCELVRGEMVMMTPAGFRRGRIVIRIAMRLAAHAERHDLGVVTSEDTGYVVRRDPDSVYAPDVAFVRKDRLPPAGARGYFEGAPDLAVEVLSPGNTAHRVKEKLRDYFAAGCRLAWVIDPEAAAATVHTPDAEPRRVDGGGKLSGGDVAPGFELPLAEVFAGL